MTDDDLRCMWRGELSAAELGALHAEGFGSTEFGERWRQVSAHSLGWVTARLGETLVGFVNVAWDGGSHAFLLDTVVAARCRRRGIGARLIEIAITEAQGAGCQWLHVDAEPDLWPFYEAGGFRPTTAGLIRLGPGP